MSAAQLLVCRQRFEAGEATLAGLAAEFGVPVRRFSAIRKEQQWRAPPPGSRRRSGRRTLAGTRQAPGGEPSYAAAGATRPELVARLWAAAGRHMNEIEAALAAEPGDGAAREREAKLMAMLVRVATGLAALERAIASEPSGKGGQGDDAGAGLPDDADGFRRELAARIAALRRRGTADDVSG